MVVDDQRILGVGVDLVEIRRVQAMLDRHGTRATDRLLTPREASYCCGKARPAQHMAARLAAKEACYKALQGAEGARAVGWLDTEVVLDEEGRPSLTLHGRGRAAADRLGVARAFVSLSHSLDSAIAIVVLSG